MDFVRRSNWAPGRWLSTSSKFDPSRPLVFMHIPKTSGTSLSSALVDLFNPPRIVIGLDRVLFGNYDDFSAIDESVRQQIYLSPGDLPDAEFVAGHMAYLTLKQRFAEAQFMTILREPCSRILSNWLYWRGQSEEHLSPWGPWADRVRLARMPLVSFLRMRSLAAHLDNLVIRMLLWPHPLVPSDNFIDPRHGRKLLAQARHRLSGFDFLDVIENPAFPDQLQRWLGRSLVLRQLNETPSVPEPLRSRLSQELTREAFELLTERSWLDLELWADVTKRFIPARELGRFQQWILLRSVARFSSKLASDIPAPASF